MQTDTLIEHVADWHAGLLVDRTSRTVQNVALTGVTSRNGYRYSEQALRDASALYEHKPVFLDHAVDRSRPHERSTRDLVGTIVNARYESGRIRGDIRVLDTDSGRTFLALSESDAPGVGMSHVVLAQRDAVDGTVQRIHDVVSVDAVVFPATTKSFRESIDRPAEETNPSNDSEAEPAREVTDTDDLRDAEPAVAVTDSDRREAPDATAPDLHRQLQQLLCERNHLLGCLHEIRNRNEAEAHEQRVCQQLEAACLPAYAVTAAFRSQLLIADEASRAALIRERRQLIEAAGCQGPRSAERSAVQQVAANDAFVAAIRRHALWPSRPA